MMIFLQIISALAAVGFAILSLKTWDDRKQGLYLNYGVGCLAVHLILLTIASGSQ